MLEKIVPDKYFKSIYNIKYKLLKEAGIKCLIFNINNTLVADSIKKPTNKVKDLFEDLKNMGFRILLVSNESKRKVTPFKELLCVDSAYLSMKPLKFKYKKILKLYNLESHEVACIGSSIIFDILGANRMDFTSIYVNPISEDTNALSKLSRKFENHFIKRLTKKGLFRKGRYYE